MGLLVIVLAGSALLQEANAGPWEVGGTGVDSKRKVKAEVALRDSSGARVWARPVLGYAHPVNERMSFEVSHGYGVIDRPGYRASGARDLDVKLKYQLARESPTGLAWLVEPKLGVPVGDDRKGIGRGRHAVELPLRASRTVDATTYTGEVRYTHVLGGDHGQRLWGVGGLVEHVPGPAWVLGVDVFADTPVDRASRYHVRSNVAAKWRPTAAFEVQGLVGSTLTNRRGEEQVSYKVVLEYKY
ncbi:hypothetical protein B1992_10725 [Pseudoxanthomonas broegbernensis]|uniref:DUF2490 domain-containing protein n=2 Tax=Pseudoxanthomonas broegbernensis TaxID=83619 RepID=A0A7V8GL91_9GAMM|nr:hypothetical protein B1992_10725 [Pseudoxanthomonas broegbernensis]